MAYDSAIVSFTTKTNKVDLVNASDINAVQSELVIIETILGANVKGDRGDLKTRLNNMLDADGSVLSGSSYPSPALPSQMFYRTDTDSFFIRNAANSQWNPFGGTVTNYLFQYSGQIDAQGASLGEYSGTSLVPDGITGNYRYLQRGSSSYGTIWTTKFLKISGINTVTVYCRLWGRTGAGTQCTLKCDIGGANNNVSSTAGSTTPSWYSFTIDVTGLSNNTAYDVTVSMKQSDGGGEEVYCSNVIGFGS